MTPLGGVAAAVALAGAARSTWSPCGRSMLSSITPLGEAGRGRRFGPTAAWFVAGAAAGGACLGAAPALLAAAVRWSGAGAGVRSVAAAAACAFGLLVEVGRAGPRLRLPFVRRQVNELWLDRFRPWVYGAGFGWQIGVGFATYVMTAAVGVLVVLAALTASPSAALALGVVFGVFRGLTVLVGLRVRTLGDLRRVQQVLDRAEGPVRGVAVGVLSAAGVAAGTAAGVAGTWGFVAVGVAAGAAGGWYLAGGGDRPAAERPTEGAARP